MKIEFLNTREIDKALCQLIDEYDEFHWAVAWGSMTPAAKKLLRHPKKFKNVTFGVAFSHTDPDLIAAIQPIEAARVATKFSGGTYHPKVYGFRSGKRAVAIIGSANFTFGGLEKNWEAAIQVTGEASAHFFVDLFKFTEESAKLGEPVTPQFASAYRASYKRAARMAKPPLNPIDGLQRITPAGFSSPLVSMGWEEYVSEVKASKHHHVEESLTLLRSAQELFASVKSFSEMEELDRKAIAGVIGEKQKMSSEFLNQDWGWFGSMKGAGEFAKLIGKNDKHLARAIDCVPQKGEVTKEHYLKFIGHFEKAFATAERTGGVATASRLLAMKRPDAFICICKPNIRDASARMGFSRSTLDLEGYWDKVIEVIRLSEWYNASKPDNVDGELWENRVAMLDTILYKPS